jgi:hypothetical protein
MKISLRDWKVQDKQETFKMGIILIKGNIAPFLLFHKALFFTGLRVLFPVSYQVFEVFLILMDVQSKKCACGNNKEPQSIRMKPKPIGPPSRVLFHLRPSTLLD